MTEQKDTTVVPLFSLEQWQLDKIDMWKRTHECRYRLVIGAAGGKYIWTFGPTSLGTEQKVICTCGAKIDVTDAESW